MSHLVIETKSKGPVWIHGALMPWLVCPNCETLGANVAAISKDDPDSMWPRIGILAICADCGSLNVMGRDNLEAGTAEQLEILDPNFRQVIETIIRKPILAINN